ncbi:MAG: aminopeptidase [Treponemataceae bacterium]|nr:aminopeptidase [Treponemataceae bacterium]
MKYSKPTDEMLKKYADLVIKIGVNLQEGQELVINADVHDAEFSHLITESAYEHGCKKVTMLWRDEIFTHLRYSHEEIEVASKVENYQIEERNYAVEKKAAYITIVSEDPELFSDIKAEYLAECSKNKNKAFENFYSVSMKNGIRWNIIAVPSLKWAKKISPDLNDQDAINRLWHLIFKTMRLDRENPVKEWQDHQKKLKERSEYLNEKQFSAFHYTNSLGTDLTLGLPENYIFQGCGEEALDGITFTANMPSEEIFSAPDKYRVNGKVYASLPLIYNGTKIEKFGFEFKDGKVVDFWAEKGYEVLKHLLDTDNGSRYLGEVALVQYDSPIRNLETLFYETLFDENASCHLALGESYPSCIQNGIEMTREELDKKGLNYSLEHVDFMVGTKDLNIDGIQKDGKILPVFRNGTFCF